MTIAGRKASVTKSARQYRMQPDPRKRARYRDDEDDDLDDLRAPIRSLDRPGEPTLDSSQAARKLWDDEVPPTSSSSLTCLGSSMKKIGGPPIIDRHVDFVDDESVVHDHLDDEPNMREPGVEGEAAPSGDRPRRRRRRRGGSIGSPCRWQLSCCAAN